MPRSSGARALLGGSVGALVVAVCVGVAALLATHPVQAVEGVRLIMVEEKGCRFCAKWEQDVGGAYATSPEGKFAPLKRVGRGAPEIKTFNPVVYTPTFIVVRGGEEVGRITGYPGKRYFWSELDTVLQTIGYF